MADWAFDVFTMASPFSGPQTWHDAVGEIHRYTGLIIVFLVSLHLVGAQKHALIDRDDTLSRMLGLKNRDLELADTTSNDGAREAVALR